MCVATSGRKGDITKLAGPAVPPVAPVAAPAAATMRYVGTTGSSPTTAYGPAGGDVVSSVKPSLAEVVTQTVTGRSRKKNALDIMRSGFLSTLKTGAGGVPGMPWLATPAAGSDLKTKLGQ